MANKIEFDPEGIFIPLLAAAYGFTSEQVGFIKQMLSAAHAAGVVDGLMEALRAVDSNGEADNA